MQLASAEIEIARNFQTWQMTEAASETSDGCFELRTLPIPELREGEVLIEIAGCGVCGSDIGFFYEGVKTIVRPPITLGHEISGKVVAGVPSWVGQEVIVPTIIPCRSCDLCHSGRGNRCLRQKMPGNNLGAFGGFSSHIVVPARDLCPVGDRGEFSLAKLAVVADAVATPYQAVKRANVRPGDRVIIIGATGGCGLLPVAVGEALRSRGGHRRRAQRGEARQGARLRERLQPQREEQIFLGDPEGVLAPLSQERHSREVGLEDLRGQRDKGRPGARARPPPDTPVC